MIYHYELYSSIHNQVASPSGEYKYIDARQDAILDTGYLEQYTCFHLWFCHLGYLQNCI